MTVLRPLLFGYSPWNFHSLGEGNQFMYILICVGRFCLVERLFGLVFYSGHAFESANSSQRVIIGLAMYDTFNTLAHGVWHYNRMKTSIVSAGDRTMDLPIERQSCYPLSLTILKYITNMTVNVYISTFHQYKLQ